MPWIAISSCSSEGVSGTALLSGLLGGESPRYTPDQIQVVESSGDRAAYLRDRFGIATPPLAEAVRTAGTVLIAVKPHHVDGLVADLAGELTDDQLLISAAGGVRISQIEQALTTKRPWSAACPTLRPPSARA